MGLILRQTTTANSGNTLSIKGSALSYAEGDGNFVYLLTNMSGSSNSITGSTGILGGLNVTGGITGSFSGSLIGTAATASNIFPAITNNTNNYVLTATGNGVINGESNLYFDGTKLLIGTTFSTYNPKLEILAGSGSEHIIISSQDTPNTRYTSSDIFEYPAISYHSWKDNNPAAAMTASAQIVLTDRPGDNGNDDEKKAVRTSDILFKVADNPGFARRLNTVMAITFRPLNGGAANGAIGINTTTPSASLHVSGTVMFPNLTTTSSVSNVVMINTTTGQLYYTASSAIASSSIGGGNVTGSGVANYISMWSGSTSLTTSSIFQSGDTITTTSTNLIVTSSANNAITVQSSAGEAQVRVYGPTVGCYLYANPVGQYGLYDRSGTAPRLQYDTVTHSLSIYASQSLELFVSKSLVQVNNLYSVNKVGIGTSTPSSSLDVNGDLTVKHIVGKIGAPFAITVSSGAGTGGTCSITGSALAGIITVTTGTTPSTNATIVLLNYSEGLTSPGYPIITPANLNSSVLNGSGASGAKQVYVDTGVAPSISFTIKSSTTGLTASTVYKWYYHIMQ